VKDVLSEVLWRWLGGWTRTVITISKTEMSLYDKIWLVSPVLRFHISVLGVFPQFAFTVHRTITCLTQKANTPFVKHVKMWKQPLSKESVMFLWLKQLTCEMHNILRIQTFVYVCDTLFKIKIICLKKKPPSWFLFSLKEKKMPPSLIKNWKSWPENQVINFIWANVKSLKPFRFETNMF
jgi:hypothetical protein